MKLGQLIKQQAKYFYSKNMRKMGQGDPFQTSFYCLKMLNMRQNEVACSLVSIYFDSPQLEIH